MKKKNIKNNPPKKRFDKHKQLQEEPFIKTRYADLLGIGIIIFLGILIYSNSFDCSFHLDDKQIYGNMNIRDLSDIKSIWEYSQTRFTAYYSFAINYHFGKLNVWGYHLFNLIIHLLNACLVYWFTLLIFSSHTLKNQPISKDKKVIAFVAALMFVAHPLATQSVTYIVQRMASMVATFYLLSIALYIKGRISQNNSSYKYALYAGALISAILAMLTKENAFTLPFAILMVEVFFFQTKKLAINFKDYRVIIFIVGFLGFLMIVLFIFSINIFEPILPNETNDYRLVTSQGYFFTQFSVIVKYIQLLFLPINQNLDYDYPLSNGFFETGTILSFFFLSSLAFLALFLFKKNRIISFGIFWFFLTLSIESSIIPISDLIFEHRTYLPSIGFFLLLSSGIYLLLWKQYKYIAISLFTIIIGSNSFLTYERNKVWKDEPTLWSDVISKSPNKARAYINRGKDSYLDNNYEDALSDLNKAIKLSPYHPRAYSNRGAVYTNQDKFDDAINDFNKAIELNPDYVDAYFNRGAVYNNQGRFNDALNDYNKVVELNPGYSAARVMRGNVYNNQNKIEDALNDFNKAIELNPDYSEGYSKRGAIYIKQNKIEDALKDFNKVIELNPDDSDAYFERGDLYYNEFRNEEALNDYTMAIELKPNNANAYVNRGTVYRKLRKYDEAFNDYNKAIELNPDFAEAYSGRGNYYLDNGKYREALSEYNKAIELNPDYVEAYSNRGAVYIKLNRYTEAINDLNQAIKLKPGFADPYINRGIVKFNSGYKESACNDFQKAAGMGSKIATEMYSKNCQ